MHIDVNDIPEVAMRFMHDTHLEEVLLLNELYVLFAQYKEGDDVASLAKKIEALSLHTHEHFKREEERMIAFNFPHYPMHKQAHEDYLQAFDAVLADWRATSDVEGVTLFLTETTPAWMQQHISTMDFVTANFFVRCEHK